MYKRKLTLNVDAGVLDEIKILAKRLNRSVSSLVEDYFRYLLASEWIEGLASELGIGNLEPTAPDEIVKDRPKGLKAEEVVREIRGKRSDLR